jgi:hypothetical protein
MKSSPEMFESEAVHPLQIPSPATVNDEGVPDTLAVPDLAMSL